MVRGGGHASILVNADLITSESNVLHKEGAQRRYAVYTSHLNCMSLFT